MRSYRLSILFSSFLFLSSVSHSQLKYVGGHQGVIVISALSAISGSNTILGAQINATKGGKVGIGVTYFKSSTPDVSEIGAQMEYSVYRPIDVPMLGVNVFGSLSRSWSKIAHTTFYSNGHGNIYYSTTLDVKGNAALFGIEVYLQSRPSTVQFMPFVQVAHSYAKVSTSISAQTSSANSIGVGSDIILAGTSQNFVLFTPGMIFQEKIRPAFALNASFVHALE